jgi:NAD dependent epimerase/dehydratase family enzyme
MRLALGEMSVLITEGRFSKPERLFEIGYNMRFSSLEEALRDIFKNNPS